MRIVAEIAVGVSPLFLAGVIPCVQVTRGRRAGGPFLLCWALLVFWFAFYSLGVPLIVAGFDWDLARKVSHLMPDGLAVMAMIFFGCVFSSAGFMLESRC